MRKLTSVHDILAPAETALCLFTNGIFFNHDASGKGTSGHWFLKPEEAFDSVVIFRWSDVNGARVVDIFKAQAEGFDGPKLEQPYPGSFVVRLVGITKVGTAEVSWEQFVGTNGTKFVYVTG